MKLSTLEEFFKSAQPNKYLDVSKAYMKFTFDKRDECYRILIDMNEADVIQTAKLNNITYYDDNSKQLSKLEIIERILNKFDDFCLKI